MFTTRLQRIETCAVVKSNFRADCNVYLDISVAETLENSSNQCIAMFSQNFIMIILKCL